MTTETVFPSPLVPSRKCTFLRCCRELPGGAMVIVDMSLDDGGGSSFKCCKMPSGVLIQPIMANSCKVTAIEHVRVVDTGLHELYQPCLTGLMFGARRWVESMARQSARMRALFDVNVNYSGRNVCPKGKKTLMKLADSLVVSYARSMANLPVGAWTTLCGSGTEQDIKVAHKRNDDGSNTSVVSVSASFHLPIPLRVTFDLLRNNVLRAKWDVLASGGAVREENLVCKGTGSNDNVSILHVKAATGDKGNLMILQNSWYDVSGSFIVYAPVDSMLINRIIGPGDVAEGELPLFPTGLALLPVGGTALQGQAPLGDDGETIVTVGFQILVRHAQDDVFSKTLQTAVALMADNIATIKRTLINSHPIFYRSSGSTAPFLN
ncbi:hypothetical protein BRADI_2g52160v3 [Brachypodium distachyon]|nr:hypothetical protein BRADI_2g52160v3 [Brachypodium distachyon]